MFYMYKKNWFRYISKNPNGFITEYSRSTASEDMAEVFSHLMYGNLPDKIDPILKKKIEFIKKGISKIDKNFIL